MTGHRPIAAGGHTGGLWPRGHRGNQKCYAATVRRSKAADTVLGTGAFLLRKAPSQKPRCMACGGASLSAIHKEMANYYPLIAGVVDALKNSSAELRRSVYENARIGFLEQMRKHDPPLDDSCIRKEQMAFEEAIRKVEAEQMSRAKDSSSTVTPPDAG